MRNLSIWGMLCMFCTCAFCTPSLRASSVPLNHQPTIVAPKNAVATTGNTSDSTNSGVSTSGDNLSTNDARISFVSPIKHNNRYYIQSNTNTTQGTNTGGNNNTNSNVTADIAAIQQQIDDLLDAQQKMADTVRTTVQTEIKNSDLTKNASFNDAVSNLQESAQAIANVDNKIEEKVQDTLVEKGIVNNRGQLLVATTDDISPLALSQKLDSTLSTKFAKKADVTPQKIAADIATNENAVQTLAARVGTNESQVKTLIASDLKQRGIINQNNSLNVATKDELPVIDSETVANALQNSDQFDNMISQNLITKGIYDNNKQLQVLKKSELTPELLTRKLDDKYAKTSDITTENLSNKLGSTFVTPAALRDKNYATKSELPVINEASVSAALANSSTLDDKVIANLKRKNILDSNENLNVATKNETTAEAIAAKIASSNSAKQTLSGQIGPDTNTVKTLIATDLKQRGIINQNNTLNVATKDELPTTELQQQIDTIRTAQTKLANNQLTREDITATVQNMDLTTTNANLSNALSDIRASNQNLQTSVASVQRKANTISENLDSNIDARLRDRGLMDNNNTALFARKSEITPETIAQNIANSATAKAKLSGQIGPNTDTVNALITQKLKDKGLVTNDANANRVVLTNSDLDTALATKNYATKSEIPTINEESVSRALANSTTLDNTVIKTLKNKGILNQDTAELNVATKTELAGLNKTFALKDEVGTTESQVDNLITQKLKDKGLVTNDANATRTALTANDLTKKLLSDTLDDAFVTPSELSGKGFLTSNSDTIKNLATKSDVSTETLASKLSGSFAAKGEVGTTESQVDNLITQKLKDKGLVTNDANATRTALTANDLTKKLLSDTLDDAFVTPSELSGKGFLTSNSDTIKNLATKSDVSTETLASKLSGSFAAKGEVGTDETRVNELISSKLKAKGIVSNDSNETLQLATAAQFNTLNTTVANLDGSITNPNSLLYKIKNNDTIKQELKGERGTDGTSVNVSDVTSALKSDDNFLNSVKGAAGKDGKDGKDGTGYTLKGSVATYANLPTTGNTKGDGWYVKSNGLLYVYACDANDTNCAYPAQADGVPIKGEKGDSGETAWHAYCMADNHLANIITLLYSEIDDCSKFTSSEYNAIMGGARAYCLSLAQNGASLDLNNGIGKKLSTVLGSTQMSNFKQAATVQARINMTGFKDMDNNKNFISACEEKYNEIMAGTDGTPGADAKPVEQKYCEDNIDIVKKLYSKITSTADCATKFTNADYTAIMGGAKAYCLSLAQNPTTLGDLSDGIGKKLSDKLGSKMTDFISANKTPAERLAITGFKTSKTDSSATGDFMTACTTRYDEIMAGTDGADGITGDSAAETWCKSHSAQYTDKRTNQVKTIASPTALSASKGLSAFNVFKNKKSLNDTQIAAKINTTTRIFASVEDCLAAVAEDPDIMTGKSAADLEFDKTNSELSLNTTNLANLNTFRSTGFKNTLKGKDGTGYTLKGSVATYANLPTTDNTKGDGWYVKSNGLLYVYACDANDTNCAYPAQADGVPIKGDPGENGLTYIPEINNGMLKWKNPEGTYYNLAEVKVKGDDGITYEPNVSDNGILTWKNKATGATVEALGSKNIKGQKGEDGAIFTPAFDETTGKISWSSNKSGVTLPADMKIAKTDSELGSLVANKISADTTLAKKSDITGAKLEEALGNRFTKTSDVNGLILSDLQNRGIVSTDSTPRALFATASDVSGLTTRTSALETTASKALTTDNLQNTAIVNALNTAGIITSDNAGTKLSGFAKTSDITADALATTLNGRYASADSVSAANLASTLGNTFAAKGEFDTIKGTVNTLNGDASTTGSIANKIAATLDGDATVAGSFANRLAGANVITDTNIAAKVSENLPSKVVMSDNLPSNIITTGNASQKLTGFAKTDDIFENGVLKANKVPSNLVTTSSLNTTLGGYATSSDLSGLSTRTTALETNAVTPDNIVNTFKQKITGSASTGDQYSNATSLENLIKAIAADVARDVSVQVSEHVSKQISSQVSDRVAKRRINEISDSLITPSKLTNFITNGIQTDNSTGVVSLKTTGGGTCSSEPVFGKSGNTGSSTCGTSGTNLAVNLSTSEALFDDVPASNTDGITADLTGLTLSIPSYFTSVSCSANQYVNTDTNQCVACPTGSTSNGGTVTSCTCSQNYYKSGNTCLPCGTGATSGGGNTSSCSCTVSYKLWVPGTNGGSCTENQTTCLNAQNTYWNNGSCATLPNHSSRTSNGTSYTCNSGYYHSGNSCLYCGSNATSESGSNSCTCKSGTWSSTSSGGTCTTVCNGTTIDGQCIDSEAKCTTYANKVGKTYNWVNGQCTEAKQCEGGKYFNTRENTCLVCTSAEGAKLDDKGNCVCQDPSFMLNTFLGRCAACPNDSTLKDGVCTCSDKSATLDYEQWKCVPKGGGDGNGVATTA